MNLELNRKEYPGEATIGGFYIDGVFQCYSLEDKDRHLEDFLSAIDEYKIHGRTAIPRGRYQVIIDWSDKHRSLRLHVLGVPGFTGIRFDIANHTDEVQGCIALGMIRDSNKPDMVFSSTLAIKAVTVKVLQALLRGEEVWLTVS